MGCLHALPSREFGNDACLFTSFFGQSNSEVEEELVAAQCLHIRRKVKDGLSADSGV